MPTPPRTPHTPRASRLPNDPAARLRLAEAQRAEAGAVADVYRSSAALQRSEARRDAAVDAANQAVELAHAGVAEAQRRLVEVSGLNRSAQLLGTTAAALRRGLSTRSAEDSA